MVCATATPDFCDMSIALVCRWCMAGLLVALSFLWIRVFRESDRFLFGWR